jgi:hypothetical protein
MPKQHAKARNQKEQDERFLERCEIIRQRYKIPAEAAWHAYDDGSRSGGDLMTADSDFERGFHAAAEGIRTYWHRWGGKIERDRDSDRFQQFITDTSRHHNDSHAGFEAGLEYMRKGTFAPSPKGTA